MYCKVVKADGTDINGGARVVFVNYPVAKLFNQMDVTLGGRLISQSNNCCPYRGMIELILAADDGSNHGFRTRAMQTDGIQKWGLMRSPHGDLFFQD